ncbi:DEAD/DEAH box helicase [Pseudonocardia oroxyli]|uniref:ATP-dependent helicase Lhr and Lhr-like helicase n=1 Tax=Pseudonocardia oroxyli TaxID=366584 RepID=A0A1G7TF51_PSEOR|nr:DEAD/DEAH box helicase [Pseudonocardia oroxyli]SDG33933.1 ATP-dependent helicase Lhr and Lhr-like helicase [Pseudonocardia oroxyli]
MSSPTSASDRLHYGVQRWLHAQGWPSLRPAQAAAVAPVLSERIDVIISAPTAGGKTEAAFLPICSRLAEARDGGPPAAGIEVLYVSPLKALINDQYDRLGLLCRDLDIPVHRWHGDVPASAKTKIRRSPAGIVVITPESLEALFVTGGHDVARILGGLRYIVVDEMHAFLGTERGMQLQSLMHRAEETLGRRVPRIALSATLADPTAARDFLRPGEGERVEYINPPQPSNVRLRVFGHQRRNPSTTDSDTEPSDLVAISERLFNGMRGNDHLVFANSRKNVETYTDRLSRLAAERRVPNEFFAHHGNLAKQDREFVEQRLKGGEPTTAVCTSTLEMGVDIGSVEAVAQIGPPPGVASLRQRMGRSGRRNRIPKLMVHISEDEMSDQISTLDELRPRLVQTVAMIQLMGERYLETPDPRHPHLSTLVQQVLSVIAQRGGASAGSLYAVLCKRGPFREVDESMFVELLRAMGTAALLQQGSDGLLLAGEVGDRMVNHYSFYTAFHAAEELRVLHGPRTLGTITPGPGLHIDGLLLLGGRRWRIVALELDAKIVMVEPSSGARPPNFDGTSGVLVADPVRRRMRRLYVTDEVPPWLDDEAAQLLAQGRAAFARLGLSDNGFLERGGETLVFPWRGDKIMNTLAAVLTAREVDVADDGIALTVKGTAEPLRDLMRSLAKEPAADPLELAGECPSLELDKHDGYLTRELLVHSYAARFLDVPSAWQTLRDLGEGNAAATRIAAPVSHVSTEQAVLGKTPFAVVDVETTGFDADGRDRIVEIAIIRLAPDGSLLDSWSTLVDPQRTPGPTRVHGLTAEHLVNAPTFSDVADEVLAHLSGAIVVAHNADFDHRFLRAEVGRAGRMAPHWPILCTRRLAYQLASATSRRLTDLCRAEGLRHEGAHSALADADATARLLAVYLKRADAGGTSTASELGVSPTTLPPSVDPPTTRPSLRLRTAPAPDRQALAGGASGDPRLDDYLDLLEIVLADHVITEEEEQQLAVVATASGLTRQQVAAARHAMSPTGCLEAAL